MELTPLTLIAPKIQLSEILPALELIMSSISEARQRVGCGVMTRLFEKLARPIANKETPSAFLKGLRWMAIDGTVFDLPDTEENGRVFGYPGSRKHSLRI